MRLFNAPVLCKVLKLFSSIVAVVLSNLKSLRVVLCIRNARIELIKMVIAKTRNEIQLGSEQKSSSSPFLHSTMPLHLVALIQIGTLNISFFSHSIASNGENLFASHFSKDSSSAFGQLAMPSQT